MCSSDLAQDPWDHEHRRQGEGPPDGRAQPGDLGPCRARCVDSAKLRRGDRAAAPAAAEESRYPSRLVRIIIPYPPGGSADILSRAMAQKMSENLGQLKREQFNLRFQAATNQLEKPSRVKEVRRDIARIKTVMHAKAQKAG